MGGNWKIFWTNNQGTLDHLEPLMGGLSLSNSQNERFCNFLFNSSSMSAPSRTWLSHCPISCGYFVLLIPFPLSLHTLLLQFTFKVETAYLPAPTSNCISPYNHISELPSLPMLDFKFNAPLWLHKTPLFVLHDFCTFPEYLNPPAMAIELCSDSCSMCMSPRISFSHDLCQADVVPVEHDPSQSNSPTNDFDFCVYESFYQDTSSADELFYDGKILPIQIKKKIATPKSTVQQPKPPLPLAPPPLPTQNNRKKESSREIKRTINEVYEKQNSKSFWRFKRSTSLNCSSGYARSLCPLPLLSRSNSTGSVSNAKRSALSSKDGNNIKNWHKHPSVAPIKSPHSSSSTSYQKPPLKKTYGSHSNGVRINPVLNVPTPSLFGLGSIFSNGKDKINKRKWSLTLGSSEDSSFLYSNLQITFVESQSFFP